MGTGHSFNFKLSPDFYLPFLCLVFQKEVFLMDLQRMVYWSVKYTCVKVWTNKSKLVYYLHLVLCEHTWRGFRHQQPLTISSLLHHPIHQSNEKHDRLLSVDNFDSWLIEEYLLEHLQASGVLDFSIHCMYMTNQTKNIFLILFFSRKSSASLKH